MASGFDESSPLGRYALTYLSHRVEEERQRRREEDGADEVLLEEADYGCALLPLEDPDCETEE